MTEAAVVQDKLLQDFTVFVRVGLEDGVTAGDAEMSEDAVGDHRYDGVSAATKEEAAELALGKFHESVPIGVLDDVAIETFVFSQFDIGMPDDMWEVGCILNCTCCGEGVRHTPEDNCAFGKSPYPYDNGYGMCRKCGGDPKAEDLKGRLGWAYVTFLEARFDICYKKLNPESKEKWDKASWVGKASHVIEQVKKGAMI